MAQRVSWDEYFLQIAALAATRSTCMRRNVGCVLVRDRYVLATGYNGVPAKAPHCADKGCLRQERNIPSGQRMDICRAVHAEANAIISASRERMLNSSLYLSGIDLKDNNNYVKNANPCSMCKRMIINAGIEQVFIRDDKDHFRRIAVQEWIDNDESLNGAMGY